jgi:hypothetical protein
LLCSAGPQRPAGALAADGRNCEGWLNTWSLHVEHVTLYDQATQLSCRTNKQNIQYLLWSAQKDLVLSAAAERIFRCSSLEATCK